MAEGISRWLAADFSRKRQRSLTKIDEKLIEWFQQHSGPVHPATTGRFALHFHPHSSQE
jgi:hypothetical protein